MTMSEQLGPGDRVRAIGGAAWLAGMTGTVLAGPSEDLLRDIVVQADSNGWEYVFYRSELERIPH